MTPEEWIAEKIRESGLKICFVAEKAGIDPKVMSAILNSRRRFKVEEYLDVCDAIGISPSEYPKVGNTNA